MKRNNCEVFDNLYSLGGLISEVQIVITSFLPICDYLHLSETSTQFYQLLQNDQKWKELFIRDFCQNTIHITVQTIIESLVFQQNSVGALYQVGYMNMFKLIKHVKLKLNSKSKEGEDVDQVAAGHLLRDMNSSVFSQWSDSTKVQSLMYCLNDYREDFEGGTLFAFIYLTQSQINYVIKDNTLTFPEGNFDQYHKCHAACLSFSVLSASYLFLVMSNRKAFCVSLMRLLDFKDASGYQSYDKTVNGPISQKTHLSYSVLLLRVLTLLDINVEEEKPLFNHLKLRILNIWNEHSQMGPVYYYNMASLYAVLKDYEECKKYYYLCFYYNNGQEIENWHCEQMLDLYRNGRNDNNLFNISHFDWFTIQYYEDGIQGIQEIEDEYKEIYKYSSPEEIEEFEDDKIGRINCDCVHEINRNINRFFHEDDDDFEDDFYEVQYWVCDGDTPFFWDFDYLKKYILG